MTIADQHTRYLLACHGLLSTKGYGVRPVFERLFHEYGLPRAIRTDNGVPFATTGIHGLSQLNVWWLRLGIQHQRILPAHPQQNGAHERMHKTLKGEAIRPPRANLPTQQRAFTAFRRLYNDERPHQALRGRTPASLYRPSPRAYPDVPPPINYPGHFIVKRVTNAGTIRFKVSFRQECAGPAGWGREGTSDPAGAAAEAPGAAQPDGLARARSSPSVAS